jgi:hypothetical protein
LNLEKTLEVLGSSKMQILTLASNKKQVCTANNREKRGLQHPHSCPLCDQERETIQPILTTCVFARQFCFFSLILSGCLTSHLGLTSRHLRSGGGGPNSVQEKRKGINCVINLGAWCLWLNRNRTVFDEDLPSI